MWKLLMIYIQALLIKKYASRKKIKSLFSISSWQIEKGYVLCSLLISLGIFAILSTLWVSNLALITKTWLKLHDEFALYEAGRYMQGVMEKDMSYESVNIKLRKDSKGMVTLDCQTIYGNKTITMAVEDVRLLKKTKTTKGIASNPLYINGCNLDGWQAEKIDSKNLRVSFWLQKNSSRKYFEQIIHCYNGQVITDE